MGESGTAKVCPYCEGKGYVSVAVDLPPDDDLRKELNRTTWVRRPCPLCDGKGHISGDNSIPPLANRAGISANCRPFGTGSLPT